MKNNKVTWIIALVLITTVIMSFILDMDIITVRSNADNGQRNSLDFKDKQEKLKFFKESFNCLSEIIDAEFYIASWVNAPYTQKRMDIPGPSAWDICYAVRVKPEDTQKWIDGIAGDGTMKKSDFSKLKFDWYERLSLSKSEWVTKSEPVFYKEPRKDGSKEYMVIYKDEGIIFRYMRTM